MIKKPTLDTPYLYCQFLFTHILRIEMGVAQQCLCKHYFLPGYSSTNVVWTYDTYEKNFGFRHGFIKYLKDISWFSYDQHFLFNFFSPEDAVVAKIYYH